MILHRLRRIELPVICAKGEISMIELSTGCVAKGRSIALCVDKSYEAGCACARRLRRTSFVDVERRRHGSIPGGVDAAISLERPSGTARFRAFLLSKTCAS